MMTPSPAAAGFVKTCSLHAVRCLLLGLLMTIAACDGSDAPDTSRTPSEDAEAAKIAELKARLDALAEKSDQRLEQLRQQDKRLKQQQKQAADRLGAVVAEAYGQTPGKVPSTTQNQPGRLGAGNSPLTIPGVSMASEDVLSRVKAAVSTLGGRIDTAKPNSVTYYLSNQQAPWTATYMYGSLLLSQKLTDLPDNPALFKAIRDFANSSRHASKVQYTSSFQPNGRKLWYLEVSRLLSRGQVVRTNGILMNITGAEQDHKALMAYLQPFSKSPLGGTQPAAALDREPTEAEMLLAMRNHPAARAGRNMFTLTGVKKISCRRLSANKYQCVYIPQMDAKGDDPLSAIIALTPRAENVATFTYAGGTWHFSGAQ